MDWLIVTDEVLGSAFGVRPPTGRGYDVAGVVDEVGEGFSKFAVGDWVFGGAMSRAVADHVLLDPGRDEVLRTPDGVDDATAVTPVVAGEAAAATLAAVGLRDGADRRRWRRCRCLRRPAGPAHRSASGRHRIERVIGLRGVPGC